MSVAVMAQTKNGGRGGEGTLADLNLTPADAQNVTITANEHGHVKLENVAENIATAINNVTGESDICGEGGTCEYDPATRKQVKFTKYTEKEDNNQ